MSAVPVHAAGGTRWQRIRSSLTPAEWRRAAGLALVILGLHVLGFFLLVALVAPGDLSLGNGQVFGIGVGITAYTLGMRHAFDADHIGAIDNTTRKLMTEGQRPLSVGFFFSLGHSSIVFLLAAAFVIGILNLIILLSIIKVFRRMRHGEYDEQELERQLDSRGFMNRFYGRATRAVKKPWHMYPLGLLFGLGFDTATEIALLATAGTAAAGGLPLYAILCLPILFAAGMSLLDTIDGAFMNFAYGWAFAKPVRKIFYNITITGLSVAVALVIGSIELLAVLADKLMLSGGIWDFVSNVDLNLVGYALVAMFVATWVIALSVWRFGRIEEKWSASLQGRGEA